MRLLVCAGMTGGGVYPAIAVIQALQGKTQDVLWIGSRSGMEETLLKQYALSFESISAAGLHGVGIKAIPGNLVQLALGFMEASQIITRFKPDVLFLTGGYIGVPVAMAARNIPQVVFIPDIEPGLALKTILRTARVAAISTEASLPFLAGLNCEVTGYPVRREMSRWTRKDARIHFGLPENEKVLLVFGGSKGALSINTALAGALESLLKCVHIIHISGKDNWDAVSMNSGKLPVDLKGKYHAYPFLHDDMGAAFAAADLAVCRAGASTLGELPVFGLPAILAPYPFAWRYQHQNAEYLQSRGGAVIIDDEDLQSDFESSVREIMDDGQRLAKMKQAMISMAVPNAAERVAELILQSAGLKTKEEKNG